MNRTVVNGIILALILIFSANPVLADRSISITIDKTDLNPDTELNLTASASGFSPGETIYIKGAFYQDGSSNYFGLTKNGDNWIKNSITATSQRSVTIGPWDGGLTVRYDPSDSGFKGTGEYRFKVGFYYLSPGGNISGVNWSDNITTVALVAPVPTDTPVPTNTSPPLPKPTPVPILIPEPTVRLTQVQSDPVKNPSIKTVTTSIPKNLKPTNTLSDTKPADRLFEILGSTTNSADLVQTDSQTTLTRIKPLILGMLSVGLGLASLTFGLVLKKAASAGKNTVS